MWHFLCREIFLEDWQEFFILMCSLFLFLILPVIADCRAHHCNGTLKTVTRFTGQLLIHNVRARSCPLNGAPRYQRELFLDTHTNIQPIKSL